MRRTPAPNRLLFLQRFQTPRRSLTQRCCSRCLRLHRCDRHSLHRHSAHRRQHRRISAHISILRHAHHHIEQLTLFTASRAARRILDQRETPMHQQRHSQVRLFTSHTALSLEAPARCSSVACAPIIRHRYASSKARKALVPASILSVAAAHHDKVRN